MIRFLLLGLVTFCFSLFAQAQPDLELTFTTVDPSPDIYTTFIVELTVTNAGDDTSDRARIAYEVPNGIVPVGQSEGSATQGTLRAFEQIWEVGELSSGETATLYLNFYNLTGTSKRIFAEVSAQFPVDLDSSPGNGNFPMVIEDDEAVIVINNDNSPPCDIDLLVISEPCDDQQTSDPSDDTYGLRVELTTAATGSAEVNVAGTTTTLQVGQEVQVSNLLISDGPVNVSASLIGQPSCQLIRVASPPASCSNVAPGTCTNNLLFNGDFESSAGYPTGWRSTTGIDYAMVSNSFEGDLALALKGASFSELYQTVEGVPGEEYSLSLQVAGTFFFAQASIQMKFLSENWQVLGREFASLNTFTSSNYQQVSLSEIAPADTKYVEVRIERYDGGGEVLFDAICLTGISVDPCSNDDVAPTINFCPQDIVVIAPARATDAPASWVPPFGSDNCTAMSQLVLTSSHQPGDVFQLGTTTVHYSVQDQSGNINSCRFNVSILEPTGGDSDLSVTRISPIFGVRPGFQRSLSLTVRNAGDVNIPLGVLATAYLSTDPILSAGDVPVGQMSLAGIGLGRTDLFMDYTVPLGTILGDYYIVISVDDTEVLAEVDETNNVRAVSAQVRVSCFSGSDFPWHEWLSLVSFDAFEQVSSKTTFSSYADRPIPFAAGQEVDYTFETSFSFVTSTPHYSVYIDMNQDFLFDPSELWFEIAGTRPANGAGVMSRTSGTATIPVDLSDGLHAVRVIMNRDEFIDSPCRGIDFGEAEEYAFEISSSRSAPLVRRLKQPAGMLTASPNPVKYNFVRLRAPDLVDQPVEVRLIDGFGRVLFATSREHKAEESMEIELPVVPQGLYQCVVVPQRGQLLSVGVVVE